MMNAGYVIAFFTVFGVCLVFVIAWIIKAEKVRYTFKDEAEELKQLLESSERDKAALLGELEDVEDVEVGSDETDELQPAEAGENRLAAELTEEEYGRVENLESENDALKEELKEAKESLEEIFKAVHEEEPIS